MRRIMLISALIFCLLSFNSAYSYWIWTPKTRKWINPKTAAKSTPKEQFALAKGLYDRKMYEEARLEFKKLLKNYPKSTEASESQFYLGLIEEGQGNLYAAYQAYQKVVDKYPFSERIQEIVEHEYKIAEKFMSGEKRKSLGMAIPVENPAIEIFNKVIENSTYGPLAPAAHYKLGLVLKELMRYYEAEDAFNKVISGYPDSEWVEPAKFQLAACRSAVSKGPDYDQGAAKEAKQKFEEFVSEHPDTVLSLEAEKNIQGLKEKEAQSNYNTGRFYEKQEEYEAARVYYEDIIKNFPESNWANQARERLRMMEEEK